MELKLLVPVLFLFIGLVQSQDEPDADAANDDADKEEENQQKDRLTEVDKEWFNIQIRTLEDKLERRNEKMRNLEESNRYLVFFSFSRLRK